MTKRKRSILFFTMLFIFAVSGPALIFYSQGYRIDFSSRKVVQTGALYFRITPRNSSIKVSSQDKTIVKTTDFFSGRAYIENLLPKRYSIEITRENYHSWHKNIEVNEKMVNDFKNITLIRSNPEFTIKDENIEDFFPFNGSLIIKYKDYFLFNNEKFNYQKEEPIKVSYQKNKLLVETQNNYYVVENNKTITIPQKKVSFHPDNNSQVIYLEENNLVFYNYLTKEKNIVLENVVAYEIRGDKVVFSLTEKGEIIKDFKEKLSRVSFDIKPDKDYSIFFPNSLELMIKEDDHFYLLDKKTLEFKEKFRSQNQPVTSPNFKKTAYFTDHEIAVLFLDNIDDQPQRKYQETVFLTRFSEKITDVYWYTNDYLIFTVNDEIKVMEIDNRDEINIVSLASFKKPQIFFDEKNLYVLSEKKLLVSEKLVP